MAEAGCLLVQALAVLTNITAALSIIKTPIHYVSILIKTEKQMKQKYIHYCYTYLHKSVMCTNVCLEARAVTANLGMIKLL